MKKVIFADFMVISLISAVILLADAWGSAAAYFSGGALVVGNLSLTFWIWKKLFEKKLVALASGLIVFKYAIFGVIIYLLFTKVLDRSSYEPLWFGLGVGSGSIALVVTMYFLEQFKGSEHRDVI